VWPITTPDRRGYGDAHLWRGAGPGRISPRDPLRESKQGHGPVPAQAVARNASVSERRCFGATVAEHRRVDGADSLADGEQEGSWRPAGLPSRKRKAGVAATRRAGRPCTRGGSGVAGRMLLLLSDNAVGARAFASQERAARQPPGVARRRSRARATYPITDAGPSRALHRGLWATPRDVARAGGPSFCCSSVCAV
jgi:hypothetical protein